MYFRFSVGRLVIVAAALITFFGSGPVAQAQVDSSPSPTVVTAEKAAEMIGGPTLVTLHFQDATPRQVFAELFRQTNIPWPDPDGYWLSQGWPKVTINVDKQPVWVVVRQLCEQLHVQPVGFSLADGHALEQLFDLGPSVVVGPFLIVEKDWTHAPSYPAPFSGGFSRVFTLFMDPKLHRAAGRPQVESVEALDDKGKVLAQSDSVNNQVYPSHDLTWRWDMMTQLEPPADGSTIKTYLATIRLPLVTKTVRWTIPDVLSAQNVTKIVGNERYLLESVLVNDGQYEVRLRTASENGDMERQEPDPTTFIRLLDSSGHDLRQEAHAFEQPSAFRGSYLIRFWQEKRTSPEGPMGKPATLVWELPTESHDVEISFAFQDIPAP